MSIITTSDGKVVKTSTGKSLNFNNLISAANAVTGEDDKTLTGAVGTLIDGYGGGGGDVTFTGSTNGLRAGTFTGITNYVINAPSFSGQSFEDLVGISTVTLVPSGEGTSHSLYRAFQCESNDTTLTKVSIIGDVLPITNAQYAFRRRAGLKTIEGVLDLSGVTSSSYLSDMFQGCTALEDVRFAPNSVKASWRPFSTSSTFALTDESVVSLINALDPTIAGTLTLYPLENYLDVRGNVVDGLFVKNASGATTIADFITNTKGWTVVS